MMSLHKKNERDEKKKYFLHEKYLERTIGVDWESGKILCESL